MQRWAHYLSGDRVRALKMYQDMDNSGITRGNFPHENFHAGLVKLELGEIDAAKEYFGMVVQEGKESIFVDKAKEELSKLNDNH